MKNGFGRLALTVALASTQLHVLPLFALAPAAAQQGCHQRQDPRPAPQSRGSDACCAIHQSVVVPPCWVPPALVATEGVATGASEPAGPRPPVRNRVELSAAPPGTKPLRI